MFRIRDDALGELFLGGAGAVLRAWAGLALELEAAAELEVAAGALAAAPDVLVPTDGAALAALGAGRLPGFTARPAACLH